MATSGTDSLASNRDLIIKLAYQEINIIDETEDPTPTQITFATNLLNLLIKKWQSEGIKLWTRKQGALFLAYNDNQYTLSSSGDHATQSYTSTTIGADEAASQTTLTLTSTSGITANDYIGIELDAGTRQWTTVSSVTNSTTLVVATGLTSAAASGNTVVAYTTKITRPLSIIQARLFDLVTSYESELWPYAHDEYFSLPNKTILGSPTIYYYDKALTTGELYIDPRPNNVDKIIKFTYQDPLDIMSAAANTFDFPDEWLFPLVKNLEVLLARSHRLPLQEIMDLRAEAQQLKDELKMHDTDDVSLRICPNTTGIRYR